MPQKRFFFRCVLYLNHIGNHFLKLNILLLVASHSFLVIALFTFVVSSTSDVALEHDVEGDIIVGITCQVGA